MSLASGFAVGSVKTSTRAHQPTALNTNRLPMIVLRDLVGNPLETDTNLQRAIYEAKARLLQGEGAVARGDWWLPRAPVPSRPDYSRVSPRVPARTPTHRLQKVPHRLSEPVMRVPPAGPPPTRLGYTPLPLPESYRERRRTGAGPRHNPLQWEMLAEDQKPLYHQLSWFRQRQELFPWLMQDSASLDQSETLPPLEAAALLRETTEALPQRVYLPLVAAVPEGSKFFSETEKRNVQYDFPGFCSGCTRAGLCYGCEKGVGLHVHKDKQMRTGGGFTYYRRDRPQAVKKNKNPINWKVTIKGKPYTYVFYEGGEPMPDLNKHDKSLRMTAEDVQNGRESSFIFTENDPPRPLTPTPATPAESEMAQLEQEDRDDIDSDKDEGRDSLETVLTKLPTLAEGSLDDSGRSTATDTPMLPGGRRGQLYKAPKAFKVRKSDKAATLSELPFTEGREYDIPVGDGFNIQPSDKELTHFLHFERPPGEWKEPCRPSSAELEHRPISVNVRTSTIKRPRSRSSEGRTEGQREISPANHRNDLKTEQLSSEDSGLSLSKPSTPPQEKDQPSDQDLAGLHPGKHPSKKPDDHCPVKQVPPEGPILPPPMVLPVTPTDQKVAPLPDQSPKHGDAPRTNHAADKPRTPAPPAPVEVENVEVEPSEEPTKGSRASTRKKAGSRKMLRRQGIKTDQPPTAETDGAMEEDGAFFPPQVQEVVLERDDTESPPPASPSPLPTNQIEPPPLPWAVPPSPPVLPDYTNPTMVERDVSSTVLEQPPPIPEPPPQRHPPPPRRTRRKRHEKRRLQLVATSAGVPKRDLRSCHDPLDYLAKYCIIHPDRLPHYERVFTKVLGEQSYRYAEIPPADQPSPPPDDGVVTKAHLTTHETKMVQDLSLITRTARPDFGISGQNAGDQMVSKVTFTLDHMMDRYEQLLVRLEDLKAERVKTMAALARVQYPEVTKPGYNAGRKTKKHKKDKASSCKTVLFLETHGSIVEKHSVSSPPARRIPTDIDIVNRLDQKMVTKLKAVDSVRMLTMEIQHVQQKLQGVDDRIEDLEDERRLLQLFARDTFVKGHTEGAKPHSFLRAQSPLFQKLHPRKDPEMNLSEVEEALQLVNNQLISEKELQYIYHILDLPGRQRINLQMFSVIAALSEKVSQVEPIIKQLINQFDFEALSIKMDRCKELFFLLSEQDPSVPDGTVLAESLALELAAGGLTYENTNFVLGKFDREKRGLVDFLDFLTYVPLFIEIHERIVHDPLSRKQDF